MGNFIDDEFGGLFEVFDENGQLLSRGNYKDGKVDGLMEYFDENRNLTKTETWENGELVEINRNP
ncbi:hypothetical protein OAI75_01730 [Woeseiaceae bacterium]|nr:hypothetical protein [Woeseiaceae bacterium]